jgi:hypothetical protein
MPDIKEAPERYLMFRSLISELAGQEKMAQQPSLGGSDLKYHLGRKLREGGDKGRWQAIGVIGSFLQETKLLLGGYKMASSCKVVAEAVLSIVMRKH